MKNILSKGLRGLLIDVMIVGGVSAITVGVGFNWSWPTASIVSGVLVLALGLLLAFTNGSEG